MKKLNCEVCIQIKQPSCCKLYFSGNLMSEISSRSDEFFWVEERSSGTHHILSQKDVRQLMGLGLKGKSQQFSGNVIPLNFRLKLQGCSLSPQWM